MKDKLEVQMKEVLLAFPLLQRIETDNLYPLLRHQSIIVLHFFSRCKIERLCCRTFYIGEKILVVLSHFFKM